MAELNTLALTCEHDRMIADDIATAQGGEADLADGKGRVEWAIAWPKDEYEEGHSSLFCNTIPTPEGGTHEQGLRAALTKSLRAFGDMTKNKRAATIMADDVMADCLRALKTWPEKGAPRDPTAWLILVGRNSALDEARRQSRNEPLPDEDVFADSEDQQTELADRLDSAHYRDDILRLHRMAHTVINGAPLSEPYKEDLWEAAAALVEELQSVARACCDIADAIQPLADLEPHLED